MGDETAKRGKNIMGEHTVTVTDASFAEDVLRAEGPVVVDFWAEWCSPCRLIAPILDQIAEEQAGKLVVAKLNVDENPVTSAAYQVMSIPLVAVFRGGELVKTIVGTRPKSVFLRELADFIQ
jgi:thioredoxin 1